MLHLVYQSPLQLPTLQRMACGDAVLFMENALLSLSKQGRLATELENMQQGQSLFVLREEIEIRGIQESELVAGIQTIDYQDFVNLSCGHEVIQTWN